MEFLKKFSPDLIVESPGRINLIGEHTDYNLGYVLPAAIDKKITFKLQSNGSQTQCNIYSKDYRVGFRPRLDQIARSSVEWENYILGVLEEISKRTDKLRGFDCTLESNLPSGSGLSSSAALECGLAYGLNELFGLGLSKRDIIELSQKAEHTYVGTQCGIMDQYASVMGEADHVILLDCRSVEHQYVPLNLAPYKIVMLNTGVSHNLATSEYTVRRSECEEGLAIVRHKYPEASSLRDVSRTMLEEAKDGMRDTVYRRCSFILEENKRVLEVVEALRENNLKRVGALLYDAHEGISKWYEVSCPESDFLVDFSKSNPFVLGARQTGGGFGGCTIHNVHESAAEDFISEATVAYQKKFGITLSAFDALPSKGTFVSYESHIVGRG